jgi:hypothetical protein
MIQLLGAELALEVTATYFDDRSSVEVGVHLETIKNFWERSCTTDD